jgi:TonB family protein
VRFGANKTAPLGRAGSRPLAFSFSLALHGTLLALVAFGPPPGATRERSQYETLIKPHEEKLVWYNFRQKLPEVSPLESPEERPPGAEVKLPEQTIVSNPRDAQRGPQLIWRPAPQIKAQPALSSPNLLAFRLPAIEPPPPGPPKKLFRPPPPKPRKTPDPAQPLPEPPKLQAKVEMKQNLAMMANLAAALANRPKPRSFVPPVAEPVKRAAAPALPEAPGVSTALRSDRVPLLAESMAAPLANRPQARTFTPPPTRERPAEGPASLPDAPRVAAQAAYAGGATRNPALEDAAMAPLANKPKARTFVAPAADPGGNGSNGHSAAAPIVEDAPVLNAAAMPSANVNVAVVGLNPAEKLRGPLPEASSPAKFSGSPDANGNPGGGHSGTASLLSVPGLLIRGAPAATERAGDPILVARAAPTSREALQAAVRESGGAFQETPSEIRLSPPPDAQLMGRDVYTLAVQMPNVSSYIGSWIMWFAEHQPAAARGKRDLRPPSPIHKVDPKYYPAAIAERIEGKVQVAGIIRADGRVEGVRVLKGVDPRLDQSAAEALLKWEFEPARRNGAPVEVDVVAEIPFLLPPLVKK